MNEIGQEAIEVRVLRLAGAQDLDLPEPATAHAAGIDLRACVDGALILEPGDRARVPGGAVRIYAHKTLIRGVHLRQFDKDAAAQGQE